MWSIVMSDFGSDKSFVDDLIVVGTVFCVSVVAQKTDSINYYHGSAVWLGIQSDGDDWRVTASGGQDAGHAG